MTVSGYYVFTQEASCFALGWVVRVGSGYLGALTD